MVSKAIEFKDKGNTAFKEGKFIEAIGHYTDAVFADRSEPIYLLNRAAAYLKLGKNEDAERDCTTAIALDDRNVKALYRRAQARMALNKWKDGANDLEAVLKLESNNLAAQQELQKIKDRLKTLDPLVPISQKSKGSLLTHDPKPTNVAPVRRRVPITIIGEPKASTSKSSSPDSKHTQPHRRRVPITIIEDTPKPGLPAFVHASPSLDKPSSSTKPLKSILKPPPLRAEEKKYPARTVHGGIFRASGSSSTKTVTINGAASTKNDRADWTLFTLTRALGENNDAEARWSILKQISPSVLPSLLSVSLDAPILSMLLSAIIHGAQHADDRELAYAFMQILPRVPRFSTVKLFMGERDVQLVGQILHVIEKNQTAAGLREEWGL